MTNASAMTLVLLMFVCIFFAALVIILLGGRYFERPRAPREHVQAEEHRQRAA